MMCSRAVLIACIAAVTTAMLARPHPAAASAPSIGRAAPDFALQSIAGKTLDLQSLRGHVVVVNFFATWCPPCRAETADLVAVEAKYRPRGVIFLGVDDRESGDLVRVFTGTKHIVYPIVLDTNGAIEEHYDIRAIPTTYVLDRDGVTRYRNVSQLGGKLLSDVIGAVLAGRSPQLTPTQQRFDRIATGATKRIATDLARANAARTARDQARAIAAVTRAIDAGTTASTALTEIENGDAQTELDYAEMLRVADPLYAALAAAYESRAQLDTKPSLVRADLEQAALSRGQISEDREQFAAAERSYAEAVSLEPNDTVAYDGEYLAAYEQRNYGEARQVATAEARIAPNEPESWLTLASSYNALKDFADALGAERRARALADAYLAKHPTKKHARYEVGRVWLKTARTEILAGRDSLAIDMLRKSSIAAPETIVQQQADEQRLALEPANADITIAGSDAVTAAATSPGELYIDVFNKAGDRRAVALRAANVPSKWVVSFCYAKVCDPYKSTITLDPGKSLKIQLKVVPLKPTGGPWQMRLHKSSDQKILVGIAAKSVQATIDVTGS